MARSASGTSLRSIATVAVAVLVVLLVGSAAVTGAARATVAGAQRTLSDRLLPAREATADLATAYVDQETGERGFWLTGDPRFLEPYRNGVAAADRLHRRLAGLLSGDAGGLALLAAVREAGDQWRFAVAEPGNQARRQGTLTVEQTTTLADDGKARFDRLRIRLDRLEGHTVRLATAQLARIRQAQSVANVVAIGAALLAVAVGLGTWLFLKWRLNRPLQRLLTDVQAVAEGEHDREIRRSGPRELVLIGDAVERMREAVLGSVGELVAVERELTVRQEHDRMAADLHDLTIQRVFGLGLHLTSAARRHPQLAGAVGPLVAETDRIIRELRTVIFDLSRDATDADGTLRSRTLDVVDSSVRTLGFTPSLEFSGPVDSLVPEDIAVEVLAVLRESLSNVARHARAREAEVCLAVRRGFLELTVRDDGAGLDPAGPRGDGLTNLQARAQRLGGTATVGTGPDGAGSVVTWRVPVGRPADGDRS